ncbi:MAG: PadR family transcriptional regulator [Phycisphaerales bacterium]|nr:MAG: PadR family transcriptional regulator [Phycisphaerales bacterium]
MSLEHMLLGLLQTPASGYDLKAHFDQSVRFFWSAELSQVYPTLKRLESRGLLSSRVEKSNRGPRRKVYSLTAAGRQVLRDWVTGEPQFADVRQGFVGQIFFLHAAADLKESLRFVERLRQAVQERLNTYQRIDDAWSRGEPPYPDPGSDAGFHQRLALRGGLRLMAARLEWCDEMIAAIRRRMRRGRRVNSRKNSRLSTHRSRT